MTVHDMCQKTTLDLPSHTQEIKDSKKKASEGSMKPLILSIGGIIIQIFEFTQFEPVLISSAKVTQMSQKPQPTELFEEILVLYVQCIMMQHYESK